MNKYDEIDAILAYYEEHMPKTVYLVRNKGRYEEVVSAVKEIEDFISSIERSAKFKIDRDPLVGCHLSLVVTCTLLSVMELDKFCDAIKKASGMEIVPLTNGNLEISFGFSDVWVPAPPYGSPEAIEHNKKFQEQQKQKAQK